MKVVNVKNVAIGEGMTKICVPLVAPTDYDVDYQLRIIAKSEPDMVEFRADMYEKCFDREALMKTLAKIHDKLGQFPIIFTFRTKGEGGCMEATLSQYHDLLIDAIDSGYIDIVDIEYFSDMEIVDEVIAEAHSKGVHDTPHQAVINRLTERAFLRVVPHVSAALFLHLLVERLPQKIHGSPVILRPQAVPLHKLA